MLDGRASVIETMGEAGSLLSLGSLRRGCLLEHLN
jgi:hypothetical protein